MLAGAFVVAVFILGTLTVALCAGSRGCGRSLAAVCAGGCGSCSSLLGAISSGAAGVPTAVLRGIAFSTLVVLVVYMHDSYTSALEAADSLWIVLAVLVRAVILPVFSLLRFVFGAALPIWNAVTGVAGILFSETLSVAVECSSEAIIDSVMHMVESGRTFSGALFVFLEMTPPPELLYRGTLEMPTGLVSGDLDLHTPTTHAQMAIGAQRENLQCVCRSASPALGLILFLFEEQHLALVIHHGFNLVVSVLQDIVHIFSEDLERFTEFRKANEHTLAALLAAGKYLDELLHFLARALLSPLAITLEWERPSFGAALGSVGMALAEATYTLSFGLWWELIQGGVQLEFLLDKSFLHLSDAWRHVVHGVWFVVGNQARLDVNELLSGEPATTLWAPELRCETSERDFHNLLDYPLDLRDNRGPLVCGGMYAGFGVLSLARAAFGGALAVLNDLSLNALKRWEGAHEVRWCGELPYPADAQRGVNPWCDHATVAHALEAFERALAEFFFGLAGVPILRHLTPLPYELGMTLVEALRSALRLVTHFQSLVEDEFVFHPLDAFWLDNTPERGDPALRYCRSTGEQRRGGCTCNPKFPLLPGARCGCITLYPVESSATGYPLEQFYARRDLWCGSLVLEPIFKRVSNWGSLDTSPIRRTVDIFLDMLGQPGCLVDRLTGYKILTPEQVSEGLSSGPKVPGHGRLDECAIPVGGHAFPPLQPLCSAVLVLETSSQYVAAQGRTIITVGTQLLGSALATLHGNEVDLSHLETDLKYTFCELRKAIGSIAGIVPQTLHMLCVLLPPDMESVCEDLTGTEMEVVFYHIFRFPLVVNGPETRDMLLTFVRSVILESSEVESHLWKFTGDILTHTLGWLCDVLESFGAWVSMVEVFRPVGDWFQQVGQLLRQLMVEVSEIVLMFFREALDAFDLLMRIISGQEDKLAQRIVELIVKILSFLGRMFMKASQAVLRFLLGSIPIVGEFLVPLVGTICEIVKVIAEEIEKAISGASEFFGGDPVDFGDWSCGQPGSTPDPEPVVEACDDIFCLTSDGDCADHVRRDVCADACAFLGEVYTREPRYQILDTENEDAPVVYTASSFPKYTMVGASQQYGTQSTLLGVYKHDPEACALACQIASCVAFTHGGASGECYGYEKTGGLTDGEATLFHLVLDPSTGRAEADPSALEWSIHRRGGDCQGSRLFDEAGQTRRECQERCAEHAGCAYFSLSYGSGGGVCRGYASCTAVREDEGAVRGFNVYTEREAQGQCRSVYEECGPVFSVSGFTGGSPNSQSVVPCTEDSKCVCTKHEYMRLATERYKVCWAHTDAGDYQYWEVPYEDCKRACATVLGETVQVLQESTSQGPQHTHGCFLRERTCTYVLPAAAEVDIANSFSDARSLENTPDPAPQGKLCMQGESRFHAAGQTLALTLFGAEIETDSLVVNTPYGPVDLVSRPDRFEMVGEPPEYAECARVPESASQCYSGCTQVYRRALDVLVDTPSQATPVQFVKVGDPYLLGCTLRVWQCESCSRPHQGTLASCLWHPPNAGNGTQAYVPLEGERAREIPICAGARETRRRLGAASPWQGQTRCDRLHRGLAGQPKSILEREELWTCAQQLAFGLRLEKLVRRSTGAQIPLRDIGYNWITKWVVGGGFLRATLATVGTEMGWETPRLRDSDYPYLHVVSRWRVALARMGALLADSAAQQLQEVIPESTQRLWNRTTALARAELPALRPVPWESLHEGAVSAVRLSARAATTLGMPSLEAILCPGVGLCFQCTAAVRVIQEWAAEGQRLAEGLSIWASEDIPQFRLDVERFGTCTLPDHVDIKAPPRDRVMVLEIPEVEWRLTKQWLTSLDPTPVERYGRSIPTALMETLGTCDGSELMCSRPVEERLARIDDVLWSIFGTLAVLVLLPFLLGVPIPLLGLMLPILAVGATIMGLNWCYSWSLLCAPRLPICLFRDVELYTHSRLVPGRFGDKFPSLVEVPGNLTCTSENRTLRVDEWTSCECSWSESRYADRCHSIAGFESMSYAWASVAFLQANAPYVLEYLRENPPFSSLTQLSSEYEAVMAIERDDRLFLDCLWVRSPDLVLSGILLYVAWGVMSSIVAIAFAGWSVFLYTSPPLLVFASDLLESLFELPGAPETDTEEE